MKYRVLLLSLCLVSALGVATLHADQGDSSVPSSETSDLQDGGDSQKGYLDRLHEGSSAQVEKWSTIIDDKLVDMADYLAPSERRVEEDEERLSEEEVTRDNKQSVDSYFLKNKYLDEITGSYLRIRPEVLFSSREEIDLSLNISAQLKLSRSRKRFKLFINDLTDDNAKNIGSGDEESSRPEVGINYFAPERYGLTSKYSLGVRGIDPYVRARYTTEFQAGFWLIEPVQIVQYSVGDIYKEETQLYFDTQLSNLSLLRIYLGRGTEYDTPGMRYDASLSIFWAPMDNLGLSLTQYCNGSTKFEYTEDEQADPVVTEQMNGIYNFGTSMSVRQNFYRDWLFYEVHPGVNFHKKHEYKPNYTLLVFLDIYFGNI
ncbi:hypothetical protein DSLASN_19820 [Desulfoluna limicola]|uniref:Uncharacterized protein n=1 Tax=Desulfoluna limicola TaxID=2810562 RepID=A0ABN6F556_9BACT|nr:hypothetical protein [Desulfoluna limicola]BCS96350.1 hypothetical protein DSLASN_19820 [Desulfoluna limicola]